ncbi:MAG: radical SAM protein [Halorhodospira halophila]|uniref:radical SAM protein n=1 Tax=Halorhodospira halophila TaxID=1053 RepID=UPI0026ED35E5|nr:radical SAM protein [Halorhodospira halophila]MCC3750989.1 radical SAM protein [Halorhodospira halophila]
MSHEEEAPPQQAKGEEGSGADRYLIDPRKFRDPAFTADGQPRASVRLQRLETLWFCTGTLCNLACRNCYIESSPRNDALVYLSASEVAGYLDEIEREGLGTRTIAFTGGEPFMNPDMIPILEDTLGRGYEALVLTNAMRPMMKVHERLQTIGEGYGQQLTVRVSVDHYRQDLHEAERGPRSWEPMVRGLRWLSESGFRVDVAGRQTSREAEATLREGYQALFDAHGITLDAHDPERLVLFPEMDASRDVPEISEGCWEKVGRSPDEMMCASSRMVIKRKGASQPVVVPCTLLPYEPAFELGSSLVGSFTEVPLNHPHCAQFCVLGGASCSG